MGAYADACSCGGAGVSAALDWSSERRRGGGLHQHNRTARRRNANDNSGYQQQGQWHLWAWIGWAAGLELLTSQQRQLGAAAGGALRAVYAAAFKYGSLAVYSRRAGPQASSRPVRPVAVAPAAAATAAAAVTVVMVLYWCRAGVPSPSQ